MKTMTGRSKPFSLLLPRPRDTGLNFLSALHGKSDERLPSSLPRSRHITAFVYGYASCLSPRSLAVRLSGRTWMLVHSSYHPSCNHIRAVLRTAQTDALPHTD